MSCLVSIQGMEIQGVPEYVIVGGRVCLDECEPKVVQGYGKYIETAPYPLHVYEALSEKEKSRRRTVQSQTVTQQYIEQEAALERAREALREASIQAATQFQSSNYTNGTHQSHGEPKTANISCTPTFPGSAINTPIMKGPRLEGQRNLQDSTFSISGESIQSFHYMFISFFYIYFCEKFNKGRRLYLTKMCLKKRN